MTSAFVIGIGHNFGDAHRLLEAAIDDCPDDLWETDLWADAPTRPADEGGLEGSAPWFLTYHALSVEDYDLGGEFEPWQPPPPFDDNTSSFPNRVFTAAELHGYLEHCRAKVIDLLDRLDDLADRPLPDTHRFAGAPFGALVGNIPLHVVEHATQIRQFLTASGVDVRPMPGDRGYRS